jgi:tRNA-Thr(GGU) m(6)t(6)A37 methyltransferase TsaA
MRASVESFLEPRLGVICIHDPAHYWQVTAGTRQVTLHMGTSAETIGGMSEPYQVHPIGWVESPLVDRDAAPKQGHEGSPDAWLVFHPEVSDGIRDLGVDTEILVLTWLDRSHRDVLTTHPRDDLRSPEMGVFSTRSPDRPNPIGLHRVTIVSIDGLRVRVRNLEALDRTPIVDVKPVLDRMGDG